MINIAKNDYRELEQLRNELYKMVNGERELHSHDICVVSTQLDKLIVKHMELINSNKKEDLSGECS